MTGPVSATGGIPAGPGLSMFDPIHVGIDEFGQPVHIRIIYRNLLAAGEPGGGKSGLLNTIAAHTVLSVGQPPGAVRRQASRTRHVGPHRRRIRRPRPDPRHHHPAPPAEGDGQPVRLAARPAPPQDRTRRRPVRHHHHLRRDRPVRHRAGHRAASNASSCPCSAIWSPAAAPPPCPSWPPPNGPRWTSSPRACGTCSATAPRSAAPPPAPPTSSSATAGPTPDSPPPASPRPTRARRS